MDAFFTMAVGSLYVLYTVILIRVRRSAARRRKLAAQETTINPYAKRDSRLLAVLIVVEVLLLIGYMIRLPLIVPFQMEVPLLLRRVALFVGFAGVFLIGWASYTLDGEFSATIELKESHRLVTTGPYRYKKSLLPVLLRFEGNPVALVPLRNG